jgi:hypothetical protein
MSESELGEVKHFSSRRKRKRFYSLSSGERKGKSLNFLRLSQDNFKRGCKIVMLEETPGSAINKTSLVKGGWKAPPKKVIVL